RSLFFAWCNFFCKWLIINGSFFEMTKKWCRNGAEMVQKCSRSGSAKDLYPGFQPSARDCIFIIVNISEPARSSPSPLETANRSAGSDDGARKALQRIHLDTRGPVRHRSAGASIHYGSAKVCFSAAATASISDITAP